MSTHNAGKWSATNKYPPTPIMSGFQPGEPFTLVRPVVASLSAAESGPFNGTTFPPSTVGFGCDRYETVFVGATWTGSGTLQVTPMFYDVEAQLWVDMLVSGAAQVTDTFDGSGTKMSEVRVFGRHCVFFKVAALGGGPLTNIEIFAMPGRGRENAFFG
jgi:hypothetical protein